MFLNIHTYSIHTCMHAAKHKNLRAGRAEKATTIARVETGAAGMQTGGQGINKLLIYRVNS